MTENGTVQHHEEYQYLNLIEKIIKTGIDLNYLYNLSSQYLGHFNIMKIYW